LEETSRWLVIASQRVVTISSCVSFAMADLGEKDAKGEYYSSKLSTSNGYEIAAYTWLPACGVEEANGVVFLLHGVLAHARFEYLDADADNRRTVYAGSIPAHLNDLGMIVVSHDHPSHGASSGLRGFWASMDELRDAAAEVADHFLAREDLMLAAKPRFIAGMSMGGTVSVELARKYPERFTGFVLFSPAVSPPADMFGWWGSFLKAFSTLISTAAPRLKVLGLPPSPCDYIRDAVGKDELMVKGPLRARPGAEFLRVYNEIDAGAEDITFPAVLIIIGETDPIVSPAGIHRFVERISSPDKVVKSIPIIGHEVLREPGFELARTTFYEWIEKRM
jgi:acylglycerol lipase